jgi:hypothetical protein
VEHDVTPFVAESERALVRDALIGIVVGVLAFFAVTVLIVRLGWSDQSWGFALVNGAFVAPWAGLFFGSAAGIAISQAQAARATAASSAPAADAPSGAPRPTGTTMPPLAPT